MDSLWTDIELHGALMVSDFTNLHCEDSCSANVPAADIRPGTVLPGLDRYCPTVKVVCVDPNWVELEVGGKPVTLLSGQRVEGLTKPLDYAYGTLSITLVGKKVAAFELYDNMLEEKDIAERCLLFRKLADFAIDNGDAIALFLAVKALASGKVKYYEMPVDKLSATARRLSDELHSALVGGSLGPFEAEAWLYLGRIARDYNFGAINMRYAAEAFLHKEKKDWDAAFDAVVYASYVGDSELVDSIRPHLNPKEECIADVMALRRRQLLGEPYLDELRRMMDVGVWQAHFMFVLSFMPSPLALVDASSSTVPLDQLQASLAVLDKYYKDYDYYYSSAIDALNCANFARYCINGATAADPEVVDRMERGAYRGLPFSGAFFGIVSADTAAPGSRALDNAFDRLEKASEHPFLWPKRTYLEELRKRGLDERTRRLLELAASAWSK